MLQLDLVVVARRWLGCEGPTDRDIGILREEVQAVLDAEGHIGGSVDIACGRYIEDLRRIRNLHRLGRGDRNHGEKADGSQQEFTKHDGVPFG